MRATCRKCNVIDAVSGMASVASEQVPWFTCSTFVNDLSGLDVTNP